MSSSELSHLAAALLHHRTESLGQGDPIRPPMTPASVYRLAGEPEGLYQYGRVTNPTWTQTEHALSVLERTPVLTFPSGMAAIAAVFLSQLRSGNRLLIPSDGYFATRELAEQYLVPNGIIVDEQPVIELVEHAGNGYDMVFIETPSNPALTICDLATTIAAAQAGGALTVVDNTTMTPLGQRPFVYGADVVVSSDTKALNGHSDALFGHVATANDKLLEAIHQWRTLSGSIPGQLESWLVHRGLETLEVRFARMTQTAGVVAERLNGHPNLRAVHYPGLPTHPQHNLAMGQMSTGGTLVGLDFVSADAADQFAAVSRFTVAATSFGGTHTSADRRARWGDDVGPGFVRLSVGCEPTEELVDDLVAAVDQL